MEVVSNVTQPIEIALSFEATHIPFVLSKTMVRLSDEQKKVSLDLSLADNMDEQLETLQARLKFDSESQLRISPDTLDIVVPPNDLALQVAPAVLQREGDTQTMTFSGAGYADKNFVVSSDDDRVSIKSSLVRAVDAFAVIVTLGDAVFNRLETVPVSVRYLDILPMERGQLSFGTEQLCAIQSNGQTACWGVIPKRANTPAQGLIDVDLSVVNHACGIRSNHRLSCWYVDRENDLPEKDRFLSMDMGYNHSCGLKVDNTVSCWEHNFSGYTLKAFINGKPPDNTKFLDVSVGRGHACGIKADNTVRCWGVSQDKVLNVSAHRRFLSINANRNRTCGIADDYTLSCWGQDSELNPLEGCLLYTSPSPRDRQKSRMPSSA